MITDDKRERYINTVDTAHFRGFEKGLQEGRAKGHAEGLAEGLAEGIQNVARKMKEMNIPIEAIMNSTGLTIDEINLL